MSNYYNEFDPFAAEWLRKLISAGEIPAGEVDTRSITEVKADDIRGFKQCHFFAGIGGWPLALKLAGYPSDRPVWTGSCPCQPFSTAGKQKGTADERHLWPIWFKLIREFQPPTIFGEQVAAAIAKGWLDSVYDDLEAEGYAVGSTILPACSVGAAHRRERLWFVADPFQSRLEGRVPRWQDTEWEVEHGYAGRGGTGGLQWLDCPDGKARPVEPGLRLLANGVPNRVGKLRGYGNAIAPQVAAEFIKAYMSI